MRGPSGTIPAVSLSSKKEPTPLPRDCLRLERSRAVTPVASLHVMFSPWVHLAGECVSDCYRKRNDKERRAQNTQYRITTRGTAVDYSSSMTSTGAAHDGSLPSL